MEKIKNKFRKKIENNSEKSQEHCIRNISISDKRTEFNNLNNQKEVVSYKKENKRYLLKWIALGFVVIIILIILSFFFHSALIKVIPKTENITFLNDKYTAFFNDSLEKPEKLTQKSIGKIKIINNSNQDQILREETRFQVNNEEDIVYKIYKRAFIKAKKSIIVDAFSDGTGDKYNRKKETTLNIPGFKEINKLVQYKEITGKIEVNFKTSEVDIKNGLNENNQDIETLTKTNYSILEIVSEEQEIISSIGVEDVSKKAVGKIKIFNNTNKNQKLRKETRFQNGELVFKTYKSTTIPSNSSVVVDAFADSPGNEYNIKKDIKFVIPGFKEAKSDAEYKNITGVAYTEFLGGNIGRVNVPNKNELNLTKEKLKLKSIENINSKINNEEDKNDIIVFRNARLNQFDFEMESTGDKILVKIKALTKIPVIKKGDFIKMIFPSDDLLEKEKEELEIKDFSNLNIKIDNLDKFDINFKNNFVFIVNGKAKISWIFNQDLFLNEIKDASISDVKKNLSDSFENFEFIISVSPFWRFSIPNNLEEIEIDIIPSPDFIGK